MSYRKFASRHLFNGSRFLPGLHLLVTTENGEIIDVLEADEASGDWEYIEGILSPGFINCHCHLELSHLKDRIARQTGMSEFLLQVVGERGGETGQIMAAMEAAEKEMFNNGIVAVGDICNTDLSIPLKKKSSLLFLNFIEATGFIPATAGARFDSMVGLYQKFIESGLENSSIVPHAPYSVSSDLFEKIKAFKGNSILTMHNQESADEEVFLKSGSGDLNKLYKRLNLDISFFKPTGTSALQSVIAHFDQKSALLLVHNVFTTEEDLEETKSWNIWWCLCPNANQYINGIFPDFELFRKHRSRVVLGTDSLASNQHLDILSEMKLIQQHNGEIQTEELLQWATSNGAEALGFSDRLGSFEKGKKPGLIEIQLHENGKLQGKARRIL